MEIKNREEIVLPVRMVPTTELMPEVLVTTDAHSSSVLVTKTEEDNQFDILVNTCSDGYGLLPIADFINPFEEQINIKDVLYRSNLSRFEISYVLEESFKVGRKSYNYLVKVVHSYDGSTSFKTFFGFVDSEGIEYFGGAGFDLNITHTENAVEDMIQKTIELSKEGKEPLIAFAKELNGKKITPKDSLKVIMEIYLISEDDEAQVEFWKEQLVDVKNYLDIYKILMERVLGLTSLAKFNLAKKLTRSLISLF